MKLSNFLRSYPLLGEPDTKMESRSSYPNNVIFSNRSFMGENLSDDIPFRLISSLKTLINCVPIQDKERKYSRTSIAFELDNFCSYFGITSCIIAGGVFRSLLEGEVPRDIDVFIKKGPVELSRENVSKYIEKTYTSTGKCILDQFKFFSCGFKDDSTMTKWNSLHKNTINDLEVTNDFFVSSEVVKDKRLQKIFKTFTLKFEGLPFNIQLIEYSFTDLAKGGEDLDVSSVKDLISTFDFACIGFGVSLSLGGLAQVPGVRYITSVYIHPSFISSNVSKILYPIRSCRNFRSCSILRLEKYLKEYGFSLSPANLKYYSLLCDFNENETS